MTISDDAVIATSSRQLSCPVDDEVVILHMDQASYYGLNAVGAFAWQQLSEPRTFRALKEAVLAEFDVDEAECARDLEAWLGEMVERGLVTID